MRVRVPWGSKPGDLVRFRVPKRLAAGQTRQAPATAPGSSALASTALQAGGAARGVAASPGRLRMRQSAVAKLQELKHLLSESEARERELEIRSLARSPPTLATPEERELARTIVQERKEEHRQYTLIQRLAARPQQLQGLSPRQQERSRFVHVLQAAAVPAAAAAVPVQPVSAREAEIAADAVEVAAQMQAGGAPRSSLQEEEEEEEEEPRDQAEEPEEEEEEEPRDQAEEPEEEEEPENDDQDEPADEQGGGPEEVGIQKAEPVEPLEEPGHSGGEMPGAPEAGAASAEPAEAEAEEAEAGAASEEPAEAEAEEVVGEAPAAQDSEASDGEVSSERDCACG